MEKDIPTVIKEDAGVVFKASLSAVLWIIAGLSLNYGFRIAGQD